MKWQRSYIGRGELVMDIAVDVYDCEDGDNSDHCLYFLDDQVFDGLDINIKYFIGDYYRNGELIKKTWAHHLLHGRFYKKSNMSAVISTNRSKRHLGYPSKMFYYGEISSENYPTTGGYLVKEYEFDVNISEMYLQTECYYDPRTRWHNESGPAKITYMGKNPCYEYRIHGERMSKKEWEDQLATKLYW